VELFLTFSGFFRKLFTILLILYLTDNPKKSKTNIVGFWIVGETENQLSSCQISEKAAKKQFHPTL
jgi:hypothetical protein